MSLNSDTYTNRWVLFSRLFIGFLWFYELFYGGWWKIPNPEWIGSESGARIIEISVRAIEEGSWAWFAFVAETVLIPYASLISYSITIFQVLLGLAILFGFMLRPILLVGIMMTFFIFHFGTVRISPFFTVGFVLLYLLHAGKYIGLDQRLLNTKKNFLLHRLIDGPQISKKMKPTVISLLALIGSYYLLTSLTMDVGRLQVAGIEIAVFFFIGVFLLLSQAPTFQKGLLFVKIFITYRLLHEIIVRTGVEENGLPGWSNSEQWTEFLMTNNTYFLPNSLLDTLAGSASFLAFSFAIVQTVIVLLLLLKSNGQIASAIGIMFTVILIILGFTRYAPFVLGFFIILYTLDRYAKKENVQFIQVSSYQTMLIIYGILTIIGFGLMIHNGIEPRAYTSSIGGVVGAMTFMFALALTISFALTPSRDPQQENQEIEVTRTVS